MKRLKFHRAIVAIAMMLIGWLPSLAHHFEINGVFYNVISTTEVEVTYKGSWCSEFYNEYNGSVVIPSLVEYGGFTYSITSIGNSAFFGCYSLTSIEIPDSITSIGSSAFSGCSSLTSIKIPNSVTSIGDYVFEGCSSLTSIEIPNSVTSIGSSAFEGCESLTSIQIPNSVTSIGDYAFYDCDSLTSIVVDAGNTKYDSRNECNAIIETASNTLITGCQNTIIPNSVTSIGGSAFYNCSGLTSIEIPNSVTSIGNSAFYDCDSLTSVVIGNSVTSIGDYAFYYCDSLTSIVVDAGNTKYDSRNECNAIIETALNTLITGCQNTIIPNSVTSIGNYAFYYCSGLTSIEIPNSVTSIGWSVFSGCSSLTSVVIGNSVTSIGNSAFSDCDSLTSVVIGNSVTSIGGFAFYRCLDLTRIICTATTPPTIKSNTFSEYSAFLFVPIGCKATYEVADDWECFNNIIEVALSNYIMLDKSEVEMILGETFLLTATVLPELTTNKAVTWKSSNESVATVDANGVVTAVAVGEAIITATTTDGSNLSATCKVTVVPTLATSIELDITEISLEATETATLIATVLPELTTDKSVKWASSDETVVVVDENGVVTAVAVGEATITATTVDDSNLSATCQVTVIPTLATSIELDKTEISLEATETATLVATVLPDLTTNKSVTWSSSNESIATVDENGVVTAIAVGEAIITVTSTDGSNLSATCKVTVVPTFVVSIEVTPNEVEAEENSEVQLSVIILPEDATYKSVEWSSSNDVIASVDANGLVKIRKEGNVVITATTTDGTNLSATCSINVYSGINGINGNDVIVATIGDDIVVKNAPLGSVVNVYSSNGALIKSMTATDGSVVIEAPIKGIYVVTIDGKSFKVMVK